MMLFGQFVLLAIPLMLGPVASLNCKELVEQVKGMSVRTSIFNMPPVYIFEESPDGNVTLSGTSPDYFKLIVDHLELTEIQIFVDQKNIEKYGYQVALTNELDNDRADIVVYWFEMTPAFLQHMDLSYPIFIEDYTLMQPWPNEQSRLLAPVRPFRFSVWLLLVGTTVFIIGFLTVLSILLVDNKRSPSKVQNLHYVLETLYRNFEYIFCVITCQGNSVSYSTPFPIRLTLGFWLLPTVVIVYAYTGLLTAVLMVPKLEPTVSTLEEVLEGGHFQVTSQNNILITKQILEATTGTYKIVGDRLRADPQLLALNDDQVWSNIFNRHCVYPCAIGYGEFVMAAFTKAMNGTCLLTMSLKPLNFFVPLQLGWKKGSPIRETADFCVVMRAWESGIAAPIETKYFPRSRPCRTDLPPEGKVRALKLNELASSFVILGIGLTSACIAFIVEISMKRIVNIVQTEIIN